MVGATLVAATLVVGACSSGSEPAAPVATVTVGPDIIEIDALATQQFTATAASSGGATLSGRTVTWFVPDTSIATVSPTGLVTAKTNGSVSTRTTFVRATVDGISGIGRLSVRPSVAASVQITPLAGPVGDGQAPVLQATVRDASNNVLVGRPVLWETRDPSTALITPSGVLTPVGFIGAENKQVRIVANVGALRDSILVTVTPSALESIEILPREAVMQPGWSKRFRVEGRTPLGETARGLTATFSSLDPAVATVTAAGVVSTVEGPGGVARIVAEFGPYADTVSLTVDPCGAAPAGTYPVRIVFYGPNPPTAAVNEAFTCAAARIQAIIRTPLASVTISSSSSTQTASAVNSCLGEERAVEETTTGIVIYAKVDSIDGVGGVLGSAGPCFVRSASRLPAFGRMRFDRFDLANLATQGRLLDVVLHEMLHVIGIGSTWTDDQFVPLRWTGDVANPGFLGERARVACVDEHGGFNVCVDRVPIEDCVAGVPATCGQGTRLGHWREFTFQTELMTGYISETGVKNPFSRMTIEALADLGYTVDPEQANDYTIPGGVGAALRMRAEHGELEMPPPLLPTHEIDADGRVRPIQPPRQ